MLVNSILDRGPQVYLLVLYTILGATLGRSVYLLTCLLTYKHVHLYSLPKPRRSSIKNAKGITIRKQLHSTHHLEEEMSLKLRVGVRKTRQIPFIMKLVRLRKI